MSYIIKATEFAQRAADAESNGDDKEAKDCYIKSAEWLGMAIKYEQNTHLKDRLINKQREYIEHVESMSDNNGPPKGAQKRAQKEAPDSDALPSLDDTIITESPNVRWDQVAGLEDAKNALKQAVTLPIKFPQIFVDELKAWRGILLYGPPGTGKTFLAKAAATEAGATFFSISSADLISKWLGESERIVKRLFQLARERKPSIIFIDEIDSVCASRDASDGSLSRVKTEFLKQMDGIGDDQSGVLLLGATNLPWVLDIAMHRRFQKRIYIALPDEAARAAIFKLKAGDTLCKLTQQQFAHLASKTDGYSGADIGTLVQDALMTRARKVQEATHFKRIGKQGMYVPCSPGDDGAIEMTCEDVPGDKLQPLPVSYNDFCKSLAASRPTVRTVDLEQYEQWTEELGSK